MKLVVEQIEKYGLVGGISTFALLVVALCAFGPQPTMAPPAPILASVAPAQIQRQTASYHAPRPSVASRPAGHVAQNEEAVDSYTEVFSANASAPVLPPRGGMVGSSESTFGAPVPDEAMYAKESDFMDETQFGMMNEEVPELEDAQMMAE